MAFDVIADPDAIQGPSPLPGPGTIPVMTFPEDPDGATWGNIEQPIKALGGEIAYLKRYAPPLTDVETFRLNPSYSDQATIQAALDSGKPLWFPKRTYTLGNGQTVINRNCHMMVGNDTTFRIADGAIVHTDAAPTNNYTPFMQVRGVQGLLITGRFIIDGNRANQTYPATNNNFGRGVGTGLLGAAGRRTNGIIEFMAGDDNLTRTAHVRIHGLEVKEAYLNGLVFWQTEDVIVDGIYSHDNTWNGISLGAVKGFTVSKSRFYRDGVSSQFGASHGGVASNGDRAGLQCREVPSTYTAAALGIPVVTPDEPTYNEVSYSVSILGCTAEECFAESFFIRACFPGRMSNCISKNVGYQRTDTATGQFSSTHFWAEWGWFELTDLMCLQSQRNDVSGWVMPDGVMCQTFEGNGRYPNDGLSGRPAGGNTSGGMAIAGAFNSGVRGVRLESSYDSAGAPMFNFNRGLRVFSNCTVDDFHIDGCTAEAIRIENDTNWNLYPPRNVRLRSGHIRNASGASVIEYNRYTAGATVAGDSDNLKIDGLRVNNLGTALSGTDDHAVINFNTTMNAYRVMFDARNLDLDCGNGTVPAGTDPVGSYNAVRPRVADASQLRIHFALCRNAYSPVRVGGAGMGGFAALEISGHLENVHRIAVIDVTGSISDPELLRVTCDVYYPVSSLFSFIGFVATGHKVRYVDMKYVVRAGDANCSTFPITTPGTSGAITTTADQYFTEALRYNWRDTVDEYGSGSPLTNVFDMRRLFSNATAMNAAAPHYKGEIVRKADDNTIWIGIDSRAGAANPWKQLV